MLFLCLKSYLCYHITLFCRWSDRNAGCGQMRGGRRIWSLRFSSSISQGFRGLWGSSRSVGGRINKQKLICLSAPRSGLLSAGLIHESGRKRHPGERSWALSICRSTEDSNQCRHHLGSHACGGRKQAERNDYKIWPRHLEEQQVQASCRRARSGGWRRDGIKGWMDGQDIRGGKRWWCVVRPHTSRAGTEPARGRINNTQI